MHPDDVNGVFEWCVENTLEGYSGHDRPDLRALLMLAKRLKRENLFAELLESPTIVEDAMLAALCASASEGEMAEIWTKRVTELLTLKGA